MKKVSTLLWVGLLLNVILTGIAWFNLAAMGEGYDYDPSYRVWSIVFPLFIVAVILQVISIILLFKVPKAGLIIAGIGSFIMIPVGMVFFMGTWPVTKKTLTREWLPFHPKNRRQKIMPKRVLM